MATNNTTAIKVSELPLLENASDFWIFVSKQTDKGGVESAKVAFSKLADAVKLERRFGWRLENSQFDVQIPEDVTIYKLVANNISTLEYSTDGRQTWKSIAVGNGILNLSFQAATIVYFRITKPTVETVAYLTLFARTKI